MQIRSHQQSVRVWSNLRIGRMYPYPVESNRYRTNQRAFAGVQFITCTLQIKALLFYCVFEFSWGSLLKLQHHDEISSTESHIFGKQETGNFSFFFQVFDAWHSKVKKLEPCIYGLFLLFSSRSDLETGAPFALGCLHVIKQKLNNAILCSKLKRKHREETPPGEFTTTATADLCFFENANAPFSWVKVFSFHIFCCCAFTFLSFYFVDLF